MWYSEKYQVQWWRVMRNASRALDKIPKNLITLAEKLKIQIKHYGNKNKFIGYGLNNFIDLIEK